MSAYHCEFCGQDLKFRVIGGTTVPLHPKGSVCEGKRYYRSENLDRCFQVTCPVCEKKVFFVRHNGGSVWFNTLGWPWEQHECMDRRLHAVPKRWESLTASHGRGLVQLWFYGVLINENGGAFWVKNEPCSKPRYPQGGIRRLMCRPEFRNTLKSLDGKLAVKTKTGFVTFAGEELRDNGRYLTSIQERRRRW